MKSLYSSKINYYKPLKVITTRTIFGREKCTYSLLNSLTQSLAHNNVLTYTISGTIYANSKCKPKMKKISVRKSYNTNIYVKLKYKPKN